MPSSTSVSPIPSNRPLEAKHTLDRKALALVAKEKEKGARTSLVSVACQLLLGFHCSVIIGNDLRV